MKISLESRILGLHCMRIMTAYTIMLYGPRRILEQLRMTATEHLLHPSFLGIPAKRVKITQQNSGLKPIILHDSTNDSIH